MPGAAICISHRGNNAGHVVQWVVCLLSKPWVWHHIYQTCWNMPDISS